MFIHATLLGLMTLSSLLAEPPSIETLDQMAMSTLKFWEVPGCAVSVVRDGEIVLSKGYGVKKLKTTETVDAHTVFPIASLTKLFTAVTLGILHDRKSIQWDDPIIKSYPTLKLSDPYATSHLTFRDCLSMRSGLPGPSTNHLLFSSSLTPQQLLTEKLPQLPFPDGFRSHFAYQNLLYLLAVKPFASWTDFVKKEILTPLSLKDTLTSFTAFQQAKNKTALHQWTTGHFSEVPPENLDPIVSAAGLYCSGEDMAHFLHSVHTLVSPSTLKEIFSSQTVVLPEHFLDPEFLFVRDILFPDHQFLNYGLGCFIHDYRGIKIIHVPGLTDGATPVLAIIPQLNLSICILSNTETPAFSHALLFQIIDAHLGESTDWNTRFLKLVQEHLKHTQGTSKVGNLARTPRKFLHPERATIAERQGASEDRKFAAKRTPPKTNFSVPWV